MHDEGQRACVDSSTAHHARQPSTPPTQHDQQAKLAPLSLQPTIPSMPSTGSCSGSMCSCKEEQPCWDVSLVPQLPAATCPAIARPSWTACIHPASVSSTERACILLPASPACGCKQQQQHHLRWPPAACLYKVCDHRIERRQVDAICTHDLSICGATGAAAISAAATCQACLVLGKSGARTAP